MPLTIQSGKDRGATIEGPSLPGLQVKALEQAIDPGTLNPVAVILPNTFYNLASTSIAAGGTNTIDAGAANRVIYLSMLRISMLTAGEYQVFMGGQQILDGLLPANGTDLYNFMSRQMRYPLGAQAFFVKNPTGGAINFTISCWYTPLTN